MVATIKDRLIFAGPFLLNMAHIQLESAGWVKYDNTLKPFCGTRAMHSLHIYSIPVEWQRRELAFFFDIIKVGLRAVKFHSLARPGECIWWSFLVFIMIWSSLTHAGWVVVLTILQPWVSVKYKLPFKLHQKSYMFKGIRVADVLMYMVAVYHCQ